jgi:hypothetical protein
VTGNGGSGSGHCPGSTAGQGHDGVVVWVVTDREGARFGCSRHARGFFRSSAASARPPHNPREISSRITSLVPP